MHVTLHELLAPGEPDLPPAPRRPGGRHRADRGSVRLQTLVLILATALLLAGLIFGGPRMDLTPECKEPGSTVACSETMPYPQPVPGAPPQAPHNGFPGAGEVGR